MQDHGVVERVMVFHPVQTGVVANDNRRLGTALLEAHELGKRREVMVLDVREDKPRELQTVNDWNVRVEAPLAEEGQIELASVVGDEWKIADKPAEAGRHAFPGVGL